MQDGEVGQWLRCGENIRIAREELGISVRELARRAKVSASHISQVERGLASFSVPALYNVASILAISMDSLFEDPALPKSSATLVEEQRAATGEISLEDAGIVLRKAERPVLDLTKGPRWERLTARPEYGAEFIEVNYAPGTSGANPPKELVQHSGREYGLILEGQLSVQVGMGFTVLRVGDSISFDSKISHRFWNASPEPVRAVWFISEALDAPRSSDIESLHGN